MLPLLTLLVGLLVLLAPDPALAWAPATHLEIGLRILDGLPQLPAAISALLGAHGDDFLYGLLACDIQVGKRLRGHAFNGHTWEAAARVEGAARTPAERAFTLGYRAHLAADVVGHNVFVPRRMVETFEAVGRGHTYWETRFDARMPERAFRIGRQLATRDVARHDLLIQREVRRTLFSFATDRRIMFTVANLQRLKRWRQTVNRLLDRRSNYCLSTAEVERYLDSSFHAAWAALARPRRAPAMRADPNGARALDAARHLRRTLRRWRRGGRLIATDHDGLVAALEPAFRAGMEHPLVLPDLHDFVTLGPTRRETRKQKRQQKRQARQTKKVAAAKTMRVKVVPATPQRKRKKKKKKKKKKT